MALAYMMALLAGVAGDPAQVAGFPVENNHVNTAAGVLVVDLHGKGRPSVVLTAEESVLVLDAAGQPLKGFPLRLHDAAVDEVSLHFNATPAACDLNGDGALEVVLAGSNGKLFAVTTNGAAASGFPIMLSGQARGPIACLPVGSGKAHDLLLTVDTGELLRIGGGGGKPQVLARMGEGAESGVGLGDLDGDGGVDVVVGGGDSKVYVFDLQGHLRAGFPYAMSFRATGVPALGDVDDDGRLDIVVGSEDYKIHAINRAGAALSGFPVSTQYRLYAGVSLADLDNDGALDVVAASGDSTLYAVNGHGAALPGFPVHLDGRLTSGVVIGDVNRDGQQELALVSQGGSVHVIDARGQELAGFPWRVGGKLEVCPAMGDLDGDGHLDVVLQNKVGTVFALKFPPVDSVPITVAAWPTTGHDATHTGRYFPNVGRFKDVAWLNAKPVTTDALQVHYRFFDLDADSERSTQIRWYLGDAHQADLDNQNQVPPERTIKHQVWHYTLQEGDNFHTFGERSVMSQIATSAPVTVRNTAPTAPGIVLSPNAPLTTAALDVHVQRPSQDADGDALVYRSIWLKDNRPQHWPLDTVHVDPRDTQKNEIWRVEVLAFDGEVEGARSAEAVQIHNTPPGAPTIALAPQEPHIDDAVGIQITTAAHDDDNDAVSYRYRYWVDDRPLELAENANSVAPRVLRKHQRLRVQATSVDDEEAGDSVDATLQVANTPPPAPQLAIWPPTPRTRDDLHVITMHQPVDADGDRVVLQHHWQVDGQPADFPDVVPANATRKGQRWQVQGTPFDGEVAGPMSQAETLILNTPPIPPVMVLDHYALTTDETVAPQIFIAATDADDDAVQLHYSWQRNGQPMPLATPALAPEHTHKGEQWVLTVTPHDGETDGLPTHVPFSIINAPPGAPEIALSQNDPTVRDTVHVAITKPAPDRDDDALLYHYRWFKNGTWQQSWPQTQNALLPQQAHRDEHWRVEVRAFDGEAEGPAALAELMVRNHVPEPPTVAITPNPARSTDDLHCTVQTHGSDADGDALTEITRWWVDGTAVELAGDGNTVAHAWLHKGTHWECATAVSDGALQSPFARSVAAVIQNTAPSAPTVVILPALPQKRDDLVCGVAQASHDVDTDAVSYRFAWQVDGKPWVGDANTPHRVSRQQVARGQNWECRVTPYDGQAEGAPGRAAITVQNTAPGAPVVGVMPLHPAAGDTLRCAILQAAHDVDNDPLTYQYAWMRDGVLQAFAPTSAEVPGRLVHGKDLWSCSAVARDKQDASHPAVSQDVAVDVGVENATTP